MTVSRKANNPQRFLVFIVVFLILVGLSFMSVLWFAKTYYPREKNPAEMLQTGEAQASSPWEKWFKMDRDVRTRRRGGAAGRKDTDVRAVGRGMGNAVQHSLNPEHLAMRELMEAQVILHSQAMVPEEEVLKTIRMTPIQGQFRNFEEKRFATRIMLMKYMEENNRDPKILVELQAVSLDVAKQPQASFEELFYAGISSLLVGDAKVAEAWLTKARDTWPARGQGYGNTVLFLMVAHAVNDDSEETFKMLDEFQDTFRDWMYVETFMPDLDDLEAVYPDSGLLKVIKGHAYYLVFNYSAALNCLKQAIATKDLDWKSSRRVAEWIQQIEEARDG